MNRIFAIILLLSVQPVLAKTATNSKILATIVQRSNATQSDDLIIIQNGKILVRQSTGGGGDTLRSAQSVTKTIVALTYLLLMREGLAESLDVPLAKFYPSLAVSELKNRTVRSLLTHTSGIVDPVNLWNSSNFLQDVLSLKPQSPMYTTFNYSNAASLLMGDILDQSVPPTVGTDPVVAF